MTIGRRLRGELAERGWSIREFQKRVKQEDPGSRGANYASVYDYVKGHLAPSLSFLGVAAKVLGVRAAWLGFGEEPMYPQERRPASVPSRLRCPSCGVELIVTKDSQGQ